MSRIIAITGMPLAGKGVIKQWLEERGCPSLVMRSAVEAEMKKGSMEVNNETLRNFATKIREERGRGVVAELCRPHLDALLEKSETVVVDGIRSPEEVDFFKETYGEGFVLIGVWAPLSTRFSRVGGREDHPKDEPKTLEELAWRDSKELGWGLGEVIARADHLIVNEGTLKDYKKRIDALLARLGI